MMDALGILGSGDALLTAMPLSHISKVPFRPAPLFDRGLFWNNKRVTMFAVPVEEAALVLMLRNDFWRPTLDADPAESKVLVNNFLLHQLSKSPEAIAPFGICGSWHTLDMMGQHETIKLSDGQAYLGVAHGMANFYYPDFANNRVFVCSVPPHGLLGERAIAGVQSPPERPLEPLRGLGSKGTALGLGHVQDRHVG